MPRGDGTGPAGLGPMTGRAAGYCAGYAVPGYMNPRIGGGYSGFGRGAFGRGGRGRRNFYYTTGLPGWVRANQGLPAWGGMGAAAYSNAYNPANPNWVGNITPKQEAEMLKQQAKIMQEELNSINQRISELESELKSE